MMTASTSQTAPSKSLPPVDSKARVSQFMQQLQDEICQTLQQLDGLGTFQGDAWSRAEGGGGRSRIMRDGAVFEQGGVNFSEIWGSHLPPSILEQHPEATGHKFYATGISMVLHPSNPYVPTVHLNYRYFEAGPVWWFGGGADLTPYYPFASDAAHFHSILKQVACDAHNPEYYPVFKSWCDEYFYLKHRQETRGVGGIFFDYQDGHEQLYRGPHLEGAAAVYSNQVGTLSPRSWEELFAFVRDCGKAFLPAYMPIVERRRSMEYGERERNFQLYRRGRYVEFNLVYDRGTIFGLQTNGRTESILMSLPPLVRWEYDYQPEPNTKEAELYETFLKPQDWANWASPVTTNLKTTRSEEIFAAAQKLMPGGVSSPVRAFKSVGGQPIVFERVKGAYIYDVDGNQYIDYVGSWGPAICGHAHPDVIAALHDVLDKGTSFGAPCYLENVLAEMVIDAVPSVKMVRFVNSGTEACMAVLRLMRAFTGRDKVVKFEGCYHGHADMFLVKAGSGVATLGLPDSPGVPKSATSDTLTASFNDLEAVRALFVQNPSQIAGVILEPVVGNAGFIVPDAGFLKGLRELTQEHGALLVFDEVMTGFRVAYGGAQEKFGVTPDLTTLGKIIGGGLPVGAYGGRQDIMSMVAPAGPMYQAGTLSGNPLAMTAGIKTLSLLQRPGTYEQLDQITKQLVNGMLQVARETGHATYGGQISGMFGFFFNEAEVHNYEDAKKSDLSKFARFHRGMLEHGVYLAPSQFEAGFTSLAHTGADIARTIEAARKVMSNL